MKNFKIVFVLSFLCSAMTGVYSQSADHLVPSDDRIRRISGESAGANLKIAQEFQLDSYAFIVRFIKSPSFSATGFLDLYFDQEKYYLIYLEEEEIYKMEIDSISAMQVKSLFSTAIHKTRHKKEPDVGIPIDGEGYFFFINDGCNSIKGGWTWSPPKNTPMWKLVEMTGEFIELAKTESLVVFNDIQTGRIEALKKELIQE